MAVQKRRQSSARRDSRRAAWMASVPTPNATKCPYCNEPKAEAKLTGKPKNNDMRGFWLIRPDGSRPPVTDYFIELWNRQ